MNIDILQRSKSSTCLISFVCYCNAHPELRFWQALLNWSGQKFILFSDKPPYAHNLDLKNHGLVDPYNFTGKDA